MKSILNIFFILTIAYSFIVNAQNQECTCGNLKQGTNPCSCSEVVVKAAELPKPTYYVPPEQINEAANAHNSASSGTFQNSYSNSQSTSGSNACSSNSNSYSSSSSTSSSGSTVHNNSESRSDSTGENNSGCGCNKQKLETLETDDSKSSDGTIVPSFLPVGDLCYPLPTDSRNGKIIEKATKVIPAYPGKIVCQNCNPSAPYEICVNTLTGETKSRALTSSSSDTTSGSNSLKYGNLNSDASKKLMHGAFTATAFTKNTPITGSASGLFSGSTLESFGRSRTGLYGNMGTLSRSTSVMSHLPPLVYANSNSARGQKQHSRMTISSGSSNRFDDTIGETQVDYSYPAMPADAVSLTLAYKNLRAPNVIYRQGKQFVPEDKLSFGHRTVPNDVKSETKVPDIPEEKLVTVDKPVVELKLAPPKTVVIGSYDEREEAKLAELEAIERESITQEESSDQMAESLITYKDLGYAPVGATYAKSTSYNGIINGEINDSAEQPCGPLGPPIPDYVPGTVVVQQEMVQDSSENSNIREINESLEIQRSSKSESCPK